MAHYIYKKYFPTETQCVPAIGIYMVQDTLKAKRGSCSDIAGAKGLITHQKRSKYR